MKLIFSIFYHTEWGEELYIYGNAPFLGNGNPENGIKMSLESPGRWEAEFDLEKIPEYFEYGYIVKSPNKEWRFEWNKNPHFFIGGKEINVYEINDFWIDIPREIPYYSSAFIGGIFNRHVADQPLKSKIETLQIRISAPMVKPDEILAITGNCKSLGNWDLKKALILNDAFYPVWSINLPKKILNEPIEYKFVILDKQTHELKCWEDGNNRTLNNVFFKENEQIVISGLKFKNPRNDWRYSGTAIPVFSLRSYDDFGVGDFYDLKKMVDWCAMTGQKVLQLLPINDTTKSKTWTDSYPYSANSSFALHPMFIRLEMAGKLKSPDRMKHYEKLKEELNKASKVDYESVNEAKESYLRELFEETGKNVVRRKEYKDFVEKNIFWLKPYAAWRFLRDKYQTPDNTRWKRFSTYKESSIDKLIKENKNEIEFFYFLQYILDKQLSDVKKYANQHGVVLKGDIPIGVGRESVDVWTNPALFNLDSQAGAPPDDFSIQGQNWGFPTYNWDEMSKDGFLWWKNRFKKMAEYFDAYRIDHILGFFRIWQIPLNAEHGLLGYFNPALPYSAEELSNRFDFHIDPEIHCRPLITSWILSEIFGEKASYVKENFLTHIYDDRFQLKDFVDSQVKISEFIKNNPDNIPLAEIEDGLKSLLDNVLFIEDPYKKGHYHPRITAQYTFQYRFLNDHDKWKFNRLYDEFFYHRHNDFWYGKAMWKLPPIIYSTSMLTCAEDLGMIPKCVPEVMAKLQILSLEIQRMPKDPNSKFGNPAHYPYFSVCTTSTHDMSGIRGWWESDREVTQRFYSEMLHEPGEAPFYAEPWICRKIIKQNLDSPSMFCILPLQDWLSIDSNLRFENPAEEQINDPSNPKHYWRYRMHMTIENLLNSNEFNDSINKLISSSGR